MPAANTHQQQNKRAQGKRVLGVLCAWLAILALLYSLLESLFFCCTAYLFPYAARVDLGFGIYPLLQTSKRHTTPEHYTAIFGDSYAFGTGDWFLMEQHRHNPVFNVAQLLHQHTQKDVISFGIPGSSNLCGWIEDPSGSLQYINAGWRHKLAAPDNILLFFYEGNDILENHIDLDARYIANGYDIAKIGDRTYFSNFIAREMLDKNRYIMATREPAPDEELYFLKLSRHVIDHALDKDGSQAEIRQAIQALQKNPPARHKNLARINGEPHFLPDELGAPPVDMPTTDIENALQFLDSIAAYTRQQYPQARMHIVYIPSPAASYELLSDQIQIYGHEGKTFSRQSINDMSNRLCLRVSEIAQRNNIGFIDTRKAMRHAGTQQEIHGLADIGHLNEAGYRALAQSLSPLLENPATQQNNCDAIR